MATGYSILYVDDDTTLLEIAKMFLERSEDFTVTTAISAAEGLRLLKGGTFDAIISDYQMPQTNGIEFLKIVRETYGNIPFILFTGKGREEIVIQALNEGADFYLQKGGDPKAQFAELTHKVKSAVNHHQAADNLNKSRHLVTTILESSPDLVYIYDLNERRNIYVNREIAVFLGFTQEQINGFPVVRDNFTSR
ncbi:response regulator [Methanoregula boonei]|uniref:response regulator n=1 Tax=Methanoregula boonei TaxID=358766 RepID=UPI00068E13D7|nr:response regulator [Methanoregula boonei]